jgi:peptidyl-prolyl cis-trans isomerase A (cyclophilin A)
MTVLMRASIVVLIAIMLWGCGGPAEGPRETAMKAGPVPDVCKVKFETSEGDFVVEVTKAWAPEGAERFHQLVRQKFYDNARFFRVVRDFVVQFGINGDPATNARWSRLTIKDDPVTQSNVRGSLTFATAGPNTRTTQVFINLKDNTRLDKMGFAPFGRVAEGMDVVGRLYSFYGDGPPGGQGPEQHLIEAQGNAYLESQFPRLDYIKSATVVQ